jgi:cation:H+ antiporter
VGVNRVVIGAVVIGFGTSAPKLLVSGLAAGQGQPEVGVGNVIGSNMANLGLIVAVPALIASIGVPAGVL